jgi:CheY-like chemotaxis protein
MTGWEETMPLKLLVVDYDVTTLEMVQDVFHSSSVQICTASDSALAVAPIEEEKFDGFLLEVNMPNVDGCRLARWIRKSSRNGRAPIIHMSTRPDAQTMHRAFEAGGTFFLVKPLERWRLSQLLRSTSGIMLQERRRYWRIPLSIPVHCSVGSRRLSGCTIRNLSVTGMLFQGDGSLHHRAKVRLAFYLSQSFRSLISARGTVVRVDDCGQVGVRFTGLSQADHRRILERISTESDTA